MMGTRGVGGLGGTVRPLKSGFPPTFPTSTSSVSSHAGQGRRRSCRHRLGVMMKRKKLQISRMSRPDWPCLEAMSEYEYSA